MRANLVKDNELLDAFGMRITIVPSPTTNVLSATPLKR
jgi:hypothetical protein